MAIVDIPFRDDMKRAAIEGRKTCTSRNSRYGTSGDFFLLDGWVFEILSVTKQFLNTVASARFQQEGFDSEEAFIQCWVELHPRKGWEPHKQIWFHDFRLLGKLPLSEKTVGEEIEAMTHNEVKEDK